MKKLFNMPGFSLIELLTVVVIIAIISAVAVPSYKKSVMRAQVSKMVSLWEECKDAATKDYLKNQVFNAASLDCLGGLTQGNTKIPNKLSKYFTEADDTKHWITYYSYGLTTTTGEPKLYSAVIMPGVARADKLYGNDQGALYFGMSVVNKKIYYCCGTWNNGSADVDTSLLVPGCTNQVLTDCYNK
jgi:prepilin-type N-terminal cleavage/methylation domain-containing protein